MTQRQRGFTLVEMVISLAIAGLLVGLVYGSVRIGQRSVSALDRQVENAEIMRIGWRFVHDAISHAGPAADPSRPEVRNGFEGAPDRLVFVATMPSYVGIEGTVRITLDKTRTPDGDQLLVTRERLEEAPFGADEGALEQAVLVERLDRLEIEYFGQGERGVEPAWQDTWEDLPRLPNLIRIRVKPADAAAWPELTAAPQEGTAPLDESVLPLEGDESPEPLEEGTGEPDEPAEPDR